MKQFLRALSLSALLLVTLACIACDDGDKKHESPADSTGADVVTADDMADPADLVPEADLSTMDAELVEVADDVVEPPSPVLADFEDLALEAESSWNGADGAGLFVSGQLSFLNLYNTEYQSWDGYGYANTTDTTTPGFDNQYSAIPGQGAEGSTTYGVAHDGTGYGAQAPTFMVETGAPVVVAGAYVTNTTYAYLSMLEGDDFAKKFGGESGDDEDWFLVTFTGFDAEGNPTGTVDFYLADFQGDAAYIIDEWTFVDLSSLGPVTEVRAVLTSSDTGDWGMNTPAFFAIDSIVAAQ